MPGKAIAFNPGQGAFTQAAVSQAQLDDFGLHSAAADVNVNPSQPGRRLISYSGGVLAIVLPAPVSGQDDGKVITFINITTTQHTITATGILNTGAAAVNTATFAAHAGGSLALVAYQAQWYVLWQNGVSFS